ncbi:DUF6879 family protein [Streptacidiphilus neutrinimicus]|uniref:DUF6879 family protein n=1 Tax=Streptacidiphilus neutrinimicus TaxID=105420 RepID=UPI000AB27B94
MLGTGARRADAPGLIESVPVNDCWVFDATVRFGLFPGTGALVRHEITTDAGVVKLCSDAFEAVIAAASALSGVFVTKASPS